MSEYQYYEFHAVDRPLTSEEQKELRRLSTRADITSRSFTNFYTFGHFKGSPAQMMERYFDAFVYITNWGENQLSLRLPRKLFDPKRAKPYLCRNYFSLRIVGDKVILDFQGSSEDSAEWWEGGQGHEWMSSLLPLRSELLSGDLRSLYLGWLACAQSGWLDEDAREPPVPPGLGQRSGAQESLADFLFLKPELLSVAAEASPAMTPGSEVERKELVAWLTGLPTSEKDALLLRLVDGEPLLGAGLLQRFRESRPQAGEPQAPTVRRTVRQLLEAAKQRQLESKRRQEGQRVRAKALRQEEEQRAREKHLKELAAREPQVWQQVEALLATMKPKDYDAGVQLLVDLREVAHRKGRDADFAQRLQRLREQYARRSSLLTRLDNAGLGAGC